jgi:spermidine/putrescine transport system ATP-binding protein
MPEDYAVELRDAVKKFGSVAAVDHVSVQIRDGEFFSLLGPSGCGKTTTLRLIAGFEMPTHGDILIGGKPQGFLLAYQRPVNAVFQHYALFPHMTVYKNISFGLEMQGVSKDDIQMRVEEVLRLVHLTGMEKRRPKQLSGGQQQRVALARALVNHPKVLLLDEPLGALDLKLRKAMQVELKSLQEQVGITFIYVTHDQEEALTMSDRIGVMSQGKLLQLGSAQEVYESPRTRFVSDFIGETNYIAGRVASKREQYVEVAVDPDLRLWALGAADVQSGQMVTVAFRPEKVSLNSESTEGHNHLSGVVAAAIYIGSATSFDIRLPNGSIINSKTQNVASSGSKLLQMGEKIDVSWPVDSTLLFAD